MKTDIKTKTHFEVTIPAGRYYLGDPCYVIRDKDWMPLLENCDYFRNPVGKVGGHEILAFGTKHGDGSFVDQHKNEYGVDAGLIGLVPVAYGGKHDHGNREVEFKFPTLCWNDDGVLHFGGITINTDAWLDQYEDGE